ncbi:MAG: glycosyltransferase family 10 [Pseudomonadota bacterium]
MDTVMGWKFGGVNTLKSSPHLNRNISFTDDAEDSDIIVSQRIDTLKDFLAQYRNSKKFMIWTVEPLREKTKVPIVNVKGVDIHIMNAYSGDVWMQNYAILDPKVDINASKIFVESSNFSRPKGRRIAALLSYKSNTGNTTNMEHGVDLDLQQLRFDIALEGYRQQKVDVYGQNWPNGISLEDSRKGNWRKRKIEILGNYSFNLCLENTNIDYYCTEKIWDSITSGCLPIYFGKGNKIYEDFPPNSFLDCANFKTPDDIFSYVDRMSFAEFETRLGNCIDVFEDLKLKKYENSHLKMRVEKFNRKIEHIMEIDTDLV